MIFLHILLIFREHCKEHLILPDKMALVYSKEPNPIILTALIKSGNLKQMKKIHKKYPDIFKDIEYLRVSAINNKLNIAKWLFSIDCPFTEDDCISRCAAMYADFDFFKLIYEKGCTISENCYDYAAESGNLPVLKYMRSMGIPEGWVSFDNLLNKTDKHNVIVWCFENGAKPDNDFINNIVIGYPDDDFNDKISIIELARKHNAEWNCETSFLAAKYSNLSLLRWLYNNKCPVDIFGISNAIKKGEISTDFTLVLQ